MDLDLEADLGIDTVKQAETFAAIRDEYQIERDDNIALRDFPTLAHVVQFVFDNRPDLAVQPTVDSQEPTEDPVPVDPTDEEPVSSGSDVVTDSVLSVVAAQTGYPVEMLEMDLDLEADLGIDTVKQAETFAAIRDEYQIERDDNIALRDFPTLAHVVQFVFDNRPDLVESQVRARVPAEPDPVYRGG